MSETDQTAETPPDDAAPTGRRVGFWTVLGALIFFSLVVLAGLSLTGRTLIAPDWVRATLEERVNAGLPQGSVDLGQVELAVSRTGRIEVVIRDITLGDPTGAKLADLNAIQTRLSLGRLIRGQVAPSTITLGGAQITVRRDVEGQFTLAYGGGADQNARDLASIVDEFEKALAIPSFELVNAINADDLTITLEDARSGRLWQASNAALRLNRNPDGLSITVVSELFNGTDVLSELQIAIRSFDNSSAATLGIQVRDVAASDIAAQSPALSYLGILQAQVSGSIRTSLSPEGALETFAATLEIGQGALKPSPDAPPVDFDAGRAYLTYLPAEERLEFSELSVRSDTLAVKASGQAILGEFDGAWPTSLTGQLALSDVRVAPDGVFDQPLNIENGAAEFRLRLDPFVVDLGSLTADMGIGRIMASGRAGIGGSGWDVALDAEVDAVDQAEVVAHWPVNFIPGTREWLDENLLSGTLRDVRAAVRIADGAPPVFGVTYDFDETKLTFLPDMPPLSRVAGRASLYGKKFVIALSDGELATPHGKLDVAGSVFAIPDTDETPSTIDLSLQADGPIAAALDVLGNPPIALLADTGFSPSDFSGRARATATMSFKNGPTPAFAELGLEARARLTSVSTDVIAPGRTVTADALDLTVTPETLVLAGDILLDDLPATATWRRALGAGAPPGGGRIEGQAEISAETLASLNLDLPNDAISGSTLGVFEIEIPEDETPLMRLTSNLAGLGLAIPPAGWAKPDPVPGAFEAIVRLSDVPEVTAVSLTAPGLRAENIRFSLAEDGSLAEFTVPRLQLEDWLDAQVTVVPRGEDQAPAVRVEGGALDLRGIARRVSESGENAGVSANGPVSLSPDRVIISDGITLTSFNGQLRSGTGISGQFTGRVNGGAPIEGGVIPVTGGTAIRIQSSDAGGAMRDAGFLKNGAGGSLDLILSPTGRPGVYDGELLMEQITVRDAPALAALLDGISIVGLLDDGGTGIQFDTVDARFLMTPTQIQLRRSAAVGASMGISMDGVYDMTSNQIDMQGVISPVYVLNGIGSIFTRRGEGLFGFNFRMTGAARSPRIAINPLSLFTPGMFREIFRRPPPRVDGGAAGQ